MINDSIASIFDTKEGPKLLELEQERTKRMILLDDKHTLYIAEKTPSLPPLLELSIAHFESVSIYS